MLTYQPDKGISFGDTLILWGTERQKVRELLKGEFENGDQVIDLSKYTNGDKSEIITIRRDIYKNYDNEDNFFFLDFDENNLFYEAVIHHGFKININEYSIDFTMDINEVVAILNQISNDNHELSEGEFFYEKMKLVISSGLAMGADENTLSCVYFGKDVSHLID